MNKVRAFATVNVTVAKRCMAGAAEIRFVPCGGSSTVAGWGLR
ncbi:hypothetical protein J2853_003370 [Streptosporangium lutulentum]|uniref:Uncharacterized protein n=1 Tax=Streptosporangium lutulentum TaxID=1461250 RepID=A0ABT9QDL9_9ACTN|nr:hypothetical protein [Streptosporangium lutulentum]